MSASVAEAPRTTVRVPFWPVGEQPQANICRTDRDHLGERLRAMYDALRDVSLPPKLQALVQQLSQTPS
jgi:hypothetical protein